MSGCANPNPYHPRNPDGTCHYWKREDAAGVVHAEPQCTYWLNEAWRDSCEQGGIALQAQYAQQDAERARRAGMTDQELAFDSGRLF